ncbi:TIM44-like domain-containing protein [Phenylobacterium immobile]|uniref:TIM44-like domain-containing protein n=1 Tax=Phenylobacterium immobile TaxID=21 RepID=UPI000A996EEC|nr:Tim44 domain-containing protein [Phenylobacterium immobile]
MNRVTNKITSAIGISLVVALLAAGPADARRAGSFGSRGARTYQAPPPTRTAPDQTAPVQRSMTAPPSKAAQPGQPTPAAGAQAQAPRRGGFLGGMGGGILGGLVAGGLIGMLMGHGFGGMAGMSNMLMQLAIIGLGAWLLMTLYRRFRSKPALANAGAGPSYGQREANYAQRETSSPDRGSVPFGGSFQRQEQTSTTYAPYESEAEATHEIGLTQADRDAFERLLGEVQDAFAREDYAALRERTTPEIMSYLSEELSQNATQGRRNAVADTRLLQADIAEAWGEAGADYATAAMRYESIDVMRDRQTGAVLSGDPERPTETVELWTFVRGRGASDWKLSAIQEA